MEARVYLSLETACYAACNPRKRLLDSPDCCLLTGTDPKRPGKCWVKRCT
jgi:hypothetical protein